MREADVIRKQTGGKWYVQMPCYWLLGWAPALTEPTSRVKGGGAKSLRGWGRTHADSRISQFVVALPSCEWRNKAKCVYQERGRSPPSRQTCTCVIQSRVEVQLCTSPPCPPHETAYVEVISEAAVYASVLEAWIKPENVVVKSQRSQKANLWLDSSSVMGWAAAGVCWELQTLRVGLQFLLLSSWIDFINTIFHLMESAGFHGFWSDRESSHLDTLRKQSQLFWGSS